MELSSCAYEQQMLPRCEPSTMDMICQFNKLNLLSLREE